MDIRLLRHFLNVASHGSIGKAAEASHITQPALSKSIRRLEQALEVELFERTVLGTQPTAFGQALIEHADVILKDVERLHEHMADAPVLLVPCLRLQHPDLPVSLPEEARSAISREFPWRAGASIYPAVQNIILACRALGLGTVLTTNHMLLEDEMKQVLGLPPDVMTFGLMPIGYPVGKYGPVVRKPIADVAFRDRFPQRWQD